MEAESEKLEASVGVDEFTTGGETRSRGGSEADKKDTWDGGDGAQYSRNND